ncbi:ribosome-inactivating family protein [Streptomyces abikoensis]|uniref:ribosome-inactivating family protein n=1 Tax=Streptomyces abikoensis TaxID=97398 RepID=UPI00340E76A6
MRVPHRPLNAAVLTATTVAAAVMTTGAAFAAPGQAGPAAVAPPAVQALAYPNPVLDTDRATGKEYRQFVQSLRLRATNGKVFKDKMYGTDPKADKDLFPVRLTTAKGSVDLVVRSSDLYTVGWYTQQNDTFHALLENKKHVEYKPNKNTKQDKLDYDGNYITLERRAKEKKDPRVNVVLGRKGTSDSVIDLTTKPANSADAASALLVLIQETNEAARFTKIDELVAAGWIKGSVGERGLMKELENDWDDFSTWAVKKLKGLPEGPHTVGGKTFATLDAAQGYLTVVKQ